MRIQAIIIKKTPAREKDELISCYTRDFGKLSCWAKSVASPLSKQACHLDLFSWVDFSLVRGNGYPIITSAVSVKTHKNMRLSLKALSLGFFLADCIDKLVPENDCDYNLWRLLLEEFADYDALALESNCDWRLRLNQARIKLAAVLGYAPHSLEEAASGRFHSLQFAAKMLK